MSNKKLTTSEAQKKASLQRRQPRLSKRFAKKLPGCKGIAIATYHKKAVPKKRKVLGYIFLYPTIAKHEQMLPGDEILSQPIITIKVTAPILQFFTNFVHDIRRGDFSKLHDIIEKLTPMPCVPATAIISL